MIDEIIFEVAITELCAFSTFVIAVLIMLFVVLGTKGGVHLPGPEFQSCSLQRYICNSRPNHVVCCVRDQRWCSLART